MFRKEGISTFAHVEGPAGERLKPQLRGLSSDWFRSNPLL